MDWMGEGFCIEADRWLSGPSKSLDWFEAHGQLVVARGFWRTCLDWGECLCRCCLGMRVVIGTVQ